MEEDCARGFKQCGRHDVMEVTPPQKLLEVLGRLPKGALILIPWERSWTYLFGRLLRRTRSPLARLSFHWSRRRLGGPGSGAGRSSRRDLGPVGAHALRSETAGLVAAALVLSECGVYS